MEESVIAALVSYLPKQQAAGSQPTLGPEEARLVIMALHCLQRLASSPHIAMQIVGGSGGAGRIFSALLSRHDHVATEAARLLLRLFAPAAGRTGAPPRPADSTASGGSPMAGPGAIEDVAASRTCKSVCFISDARCGSLLLPLKLGPESRGASPLLAGAIMEVVAAVACKPGSRTTELATKEALLHEVAAMGRPLFALFNHPARQIGDAAALAMQAIAEGGAGAAAPMREAALSEGAVLHHLLRAMGPSTPRQQLSRHLVALWSDAHEPTLRLLRRIFPPGLMRFLDEPKKKSVPPPARRLGPPDRRSLLGTSTSVGESTGTTGPGHMLAPNTSPRHIPSTTSTESELLHNNSTTPTPSTTAPGRVPPIGQVPSNSTGGGFSPIVSPRNSTRVPSRLSSQGGPASGQATTTPAAAAGGGSVSSPAENRRTSPTIAPPGAPSLTRNEAVPPSIGTPTTTSSSTNRTGTAGGIVNVPGGLVSHANTGQVQGMDTTSFYGTSSLSVGTGQQLLNVGSGGGRELPLPPAQIAERLLSGGRRPSGTPELRGNWEAFWSAVDKDHCHAALIWNERTRAELREALQVSNK